MAEDGQFTSAATTTDENPLKDVKFTLDGVKFECKGRLSILELSELAAKSISDGTAEAAETAAVYQTLSLAFGPEEYVRFKAHRREHKTSDETILGILQWLNTKVQQNIEEIAARPTLPSSSSSPGPEGQAGQPVRTISPGKGTMTIEGNGDAVLAAREQAGRAPKTRQRGGSRRTA